MRYLTQSELKKFRECRRAWWLTYHRGLRIKAEHQSIGAAYLGSVCHALLEADANKEDWREVHTELLRASDELLAEDGEKRAQAQAAFAHAEIIVDGYFNWLEATGADQFHETIAAEQKVEAPLKDGVMLMGKLDELRVDTNTGQKLFVDYKTTPNLTDIPKRAHIDEQFLHYTTILSLQDGDDALPSKGIWRMLTKSKRTDRTIKEDGSVSEFYGEHEYEFNKHQLESYMIRLGGILESIEQVERELNEGANPLAVVYPTPSNDCSWKCEFYGICSMFDDGSRVDEFIADWYDERDPLERYQEAPTERESE